MTSSSAASSSTPRPAAWRLRPLSPADLAPLERILGDTGAFTPDEVSVALELLGEAVAPPADDPDPYLALVAEDEVAGVLGYVCYGHRPGLARDFDLYWIAVDPATQGSGVGKALVAAVEEAVRALGGGRIIIETASKPSYAATRAFYGRTGYVEDHREPDHYAPGDDKVVYVKVV